MRARLLVFGLLLLWCCGLLAARIVKTGSLAYAFMAWNLFLAVIPALAAMAFVLSRNTAARAAMFVVWLLFLPNAPYIATDFVHLRPRPGAPLWFDIALLLSCAATGILLAFTSVADVQSVVESKFGRRAGWAFSLFILVLCGFGIYLGRFLRWNSWDVMTDPLDTMSYLAASAAHPAEHPRTFGVTLIYGIMLALGYAAFHATRRADLSVRSSHVPLP